MHSLCLGTASYATALYSGVQFEDLLLTSFMACRYTGKQTCRNQLKLTFGSAAVSPTSDAYLYLQSRSG